MKIGVPREIKPDENRVALTPAGAAALVADDHEVLIERNAGAGSGFADADYEQAGARIVAAETAWSAELVLKVKEPVAAEYSALTGQILFTYLHLAGVDPALTETLLANRTTAIAYETVEDAVGRLPLLAPMSAVAGAMAVAMGNFHLARFNGGRGMLLGRIFERSFGDVLVVGDGVAGSHAARAAAGLGADVCVAGLESQRLPELRRFIGADFRFIRSAPETLAAEIRNADLVIGAVLLHGARAPHVISEAMVKTMRRGAVIVDISIDQGGCVATSRPTTHHAPVFEKHGVIHYCVTNMPGAYPRLSTLALTEATLPYVRRLAACGLDALREDPGFARGLNTLDGRIACRPVAEALGRLDRYAPLA